MLKEIHEQPKVIKDTINSVLTDGNISFESVGLSDEDMKNIQQVYIVACGSPTMLVWWLSMLSKN